MAMVLSPLLRVDPNFSTAELVPVRARVLDTDRKTAKQIAVEMECTVEEVYGLLIHQQLKTVGKSLKLDFSQ